MSFVRTNLVHQQLWTDVSTFEAGGYEFLKGTPPKILHPDDPQPPQQEIVLVSQTRQQWSVAQWSEVFKLIDRPRIVMAMVTEDSTVVYYIIYRGLQVPRKN